jgi:hypothetical protein
MLDPVPVVLAVGYIDDGMSHDGDVVLRTTGGVGVEWLSWA